MRRLKNLLVAMALLACAPIQLFAQGTTFTYQGRLNTNAVPANGLYDFEFSLSNAPSGGVQVGSTITETAIGVTNGLFITTLNFGAVFTGNATWLAISVRSNNVGSYTLMTPLQELNPTPYAIFANTASNVSGPVSATQLSGDVPNASLGGTYGSPVTLSNAGNSFTGSGAGLTGVNAQSLNGLNASNFWQLTGNSGTTPGVNYVGTSDNQPVELHANGQRALRLEPGGASPLAATNTPTGAPNVIGGSQLNSVAAGVVGSVIGGGGATNWAGAKFTNSIASYSDFSVIGGGIVNVIQTNSFISTISGGDENTIEADAVAAVIGGGGNNTIETNSSGATISGGAFNRILSNASYSTSAGGYDNLISGDLNNSGASVIGGGEYNSITSNAPFSLIGGGENNQIAGDDEATGGSVVVGGDNNIIYSNSANSVIGGGTENSVGYYSPYSTLGGGYGNQVGGSYSTVPGGLDNLAFGFASFAAGDGAQTIFDGTFVWSDIEGPLFVASGQDQFLIRAGGGVGIGTNAPQAAVDVVSDGGIADPQVRLVQQNGSDYTRLRFQTGILPNWDMAVGGPTDIMNWYLPPYGNVMSLTTNGTLTTTAVTTGGLTVNNSGAIHVSGAGQNTKTAAFIQVTSAANIYGNATSINNSLCNGNPNAILIVTHVFNTTAGAENHVVGVGYGYGGGPANEWAIYNADINSMDVGATYNVLIILP